MSDNTKPSGPCAPPMCRIAMRGQGYHVADKCRECEDGPCKFPIGNPALRITDNTEQKLFDPKIITEFINPPIPIRHFDWAAHFHGYEPGEPIGYGATEEDAIADLRTQQDAEVRKDWVLVPREPTDEMIGAGNAADYAATTHKPAEIIYRAMIAEAIIAALEATRK